LLTKKQNEFIDTFETNEQLARNIVSILEDVIKNESDIEVEQYIPTLINTKFVDVNKIKYNIVINNCDIAIKEEYYNFFKSLKCKLYYNARGSKYAPLIIYDKENNIVGLVCGVKVRPEDINNAIDYNNYITEQKQKKEVDGYRFYAIRNKTQNYDNAYVQINEYVYPICSISRIDDAVQEIKNKNIDLLKWIEDDFNNRMSNKMQGVSIGIAEMLGRKEEAIEHNKILYEIRNFR